MRLTELSTALHADIRRTTKITIRDTFRRMIMRHVVMLACLVSLVNAAPEADKEPSPPQPIEAKHWDVPFRPETSTLVGSYASIIRRGEDDFVAFNNTVSGDLQGGVLMWKGNDHRTFEKLGVVFTHEQINDVFGPGGELFPKRRLTRPFIDWHPDAGFVGIVHVAPITRRSTVASTRR